MRVRPNAQPVKSGISKCDSIRSPHETSGYTSLIDAILHCPVTPTAQIRYLLDLMLKTAAVKCCLFLGWNSTTCA